MATKTSQKSKTGLQSIDELYVLQQRVKKAISVIEKGLPAQKDLTEEQRQQLVEALLPILEGYIKESNRIQASDHEAQIKAVGALGVKVRSEAATMSVPQGKDKVRWTLRHSTNITPEERRMANAATEDDQIRELYESVAEEHTRTIAHPDLSKKKQLRT